MNKKAQLPTIVLPLMALILVGVALYSFVSFKDAMQPQSELLSEMVQEIEFNEPYVLAETKLIVKEAIQNCPSCSEEQLKDKIKDAAQWREERFYREELGNFFGELRNKKVKVENKDNKIKIEIENVFIQSSREYNKIKRNFTICMEFDKTGDFIGGCEISQEKQDETKTQETNLEKTQTPPPPQTQTTTIDLTGHSYQLITSPLDQQTKNLVVDKFDTEIEFNHGNIKAKTYAGTNEIVGQYDKSEKADIDSWSAMQVPLGERETLAEIDNEKIEDISEGKIKTERGLVEIQETVQSEDEVNSVPETINDPVHGLLTQASDEGRYYLYRNQKNNLFTIEKDKSYTLLPKEQTGNKDNFYIDQNGAPYSEVEIIITAPDGTKIKLYQKEKANPDILVYGQEQTGNYWENGAYACGPAAIEEIYKRKGKITTTAEIQKMRGDGAGLRRGFLTLFSQQAKQITWPDEMIKMVKAGGFKIKKILGLNPLNKAEEAIKNENAIILARVSFGQLKEHWTIYDGNGKFYDDNSISCKNCKIVELYKIT